ncbi:MAG: hypothetical protein LH616_02475 [Ilumatobacteraceae bacterium]|nr:hypothetical protein [Ilumatobacteraceae bacterium]
MSLDVIDLRQNHVLPGSKVRRHYTHHDYTEEKCEAWRKLSSRVDAVLAGSWDLDSTVAVPKSLADTKSRSID